MFRVWALGGSLPRVSVCVSVCARTCFFMGPTYFQMLMWTAFWEAPGEVEEARSAGTPDGKYAPASRADASSLASGTNQTPAG